MTVAIPIGASDFEIVKRPTGAFLVDFETVEDGLEPWAKVFGPFKDEKVAVGFYDKFLSMGYSSNEGGLLFLKEEMEDNNADSS